VVTAITDARVRASALAEVPQQEEVWVDLGLGEFTDERS
jgi:hypothetical protein